MTVVADLESSRVLYVADDRSQAALDGYWASLPREHLVAIEAIVMDMCAPYIQSVMLNVPFADEKLVFDKFHTAQNLNQGVDQVRRSEHRRLSAEGDAVLKGTKFVWLRHPASFTRAAGVAFDALRERVHRVARAWELKEAAMAIYFHCGGIDLYPTGIT